jgi:hypothetical protein
MFRAQNALGLLPRGEGSMRFHPKSRASTDQRPGPNIARAPPMVPASRHTTEFRSVISSCAISITATTMPAGGVQSPAMRRTPDTITDMARVACNGGWLHSAGPAWTTSTEPATTRMSSNPMPGQLSANVEYRRRNTYLGRIFR